MSIEAILFEAGFVTLTDDGGRKTQHPIADMLRAADIPVGLTYSQVAAITALANLIAVLIRTLIDRGVLDESFGESDGDLSLDLEHIIHTIEEMGGAYHEPDLNVG